MRHHGGAIAAASLLVLIGAGLVSAADPPSIAAAPAFTAEQLLAAPRNGWVSNGGTLYNQRYSPLTLINRDNVKGLRALWRTAMGSGTTPGHAGQAQILAFDGVLYRENACLACHGTEGTGGHGGGPTLIGKMNAAQMRLITTTGRNNMPTFRDIYDANQIRDVAEYIVTVLPGKGAAATAKP